MRCFLPCFSPSQRQKQLSKPLNNANHISISSQPIQQNPVLEESIHWISQSKEIAATPQSSDSLFSVSIGRGKPVSAEEENAADNNEVNSTPMQAKDVSGSTPIVVPLKEAKDKDEDRRMNQSMLEYRYGDCFDDGYDDINLDDDDEKKTGEEGSSESSLFSLSTNFSNRKRVSFSSIEKVDNEVSSRMVAVLQGEEDDDVFSSVLNPIGNVSQGKVKVVKSTVLNPIKKDKENINWIEEENSLKVSSSKRKMKETENEKKEIGVDTSLSDWLVESENNDNIPKRGDVEDRPILRALTVEEIRKYSSVSKTSSRLANESSG